MNRSVELKFGLFERLGYINFDAIEAIVPKRFFKGGTIYLLSGAKIKVKQLPKDLIQAWVKAQMELQQKAKQMKAEALKEQENQDAKNN